jgi:hypothetical protein
MLRVMGLALLLVVGAVVPAAADDARNSRDGLAGGVRPSAATEAQLSGDARAPDRPAALAPERQERRPRIYLPWLAQAGSGFAVSLSERFSLGVGYRHVVGEDLWREFADAGSVDYDSHNILLRANWRF